MTGREFRSERDGARRRFWFRCVQLVLAAAIAMMLLIGVTGAIPSRDVVTLLDRGKEELDASHYRRAERYFAQVLPAESNSLYARVGLTCAFLHQGNGSRALLELSLALEQGLLPTALGDCGGGISLDRRYFVAKVGALGAFIAPRIDSAGAIEERLLERPPESEDDEARRFLLGACLAFRAGLDAAGWNWAANGAELGIPAHYIGLLPRCLGREVLSHLDCLAVGPPDRPEAPIDCILNGRAAVAFERERPYLFPVDRPLAYFP